MSRSLDFVADLEAFDLLRDPALNDSRWVRLLESLYQRLEEQSHSHTMMDALPDGLLRVSVHGEILESNRMARAMFGQGDSHVAYLRDCFPSVVETVVLSAIQHVTQTHLEKQIEFNLNGVHFARHFEARICPLQDEQALILIRDVTEQRWMQKARAFSESYFQALIQHMNMGMLICTLDGEIIIANDAFLRMLNQRDEELLGQYYTDLISAIAPDSDTCQALLKQFETVKANQIYPQVKLRVSKPDQVGHIWLLVDVEMERDKNAQTNQIKITFMDVTDFRNAEIALKESEEQYAALMDRITDVIYHLDNEQEILFLNAAWLRLTGFAVENSLGCCILDFVHPDDKEFCEAAFRESVQTEVTDIEIRLVKPDQGLCWVTLRNQLVTAPDGRVIGHYGMMIDITDRKRNEITRSALLAKARSVEILTALLGNISHDLRTPLSIINVASFKMSRYWKQLDEDQRTDALRQINTQVSRIGGFLEEYSELVRLDVELTDFKTTSITLDKLVQDVIRNRLARYADNLPEWKLETDPVDCLIMGNAEWLSSLIQHLFDNAVQYSPEHGPIVVRVQREAAHVLLEVKDQGIGIAASDLEHIFDPLYRADKARAVNKGLAGLGLTFVRRIAEAHQAHVEIDSTVGVGTAVRVYFPVQAEYEDSVE